MRFLSVQKSGSLPRQLWMGRSSQTLPSQNQGLGNRRLQLSTKWRAQLIPIDNFKPVATQTAGLTIRGSQTKTKGQDILLEW